MARVIQPSREAMQRAWALGRKMATVDPRMRPMMAEAATFKQYEEFRRVHRSQMEGRDAFQGWEDQVSGLAEREARRIGMRMDSNAALDAFIARLVVPMKHAFWLGWEATRGLEKLHAEVRRRAAEESTVGTPVKVFRATQLADRVQKPELADTSDDGFFLSVTGDGKEVRDRSKPQVLAATALVNVAKQEQKTEPADDDLSLVGLEVEQITAAAVTPGEAHENPAAVVLNDDDVPDPYDTTP